MQIFYEVNHSLTIPVIHYILQCFFRFYHLLQVYIFMVCSWMERVGTGVMPAWLNQHRRFYTHPFLLSMCLPPTKTKQRHPTFMSAQSTRSPDVPIWPTSSHLCWRRIRIQTTGPCVVSVFCVTQNRNTKWKIFYKAEVLYCLVCEINWYMYTDFQEKYCYLLFVENVTMIIIYNYNVIFASMHHLDGCFKTKMTLLYQKTIRP